MGYTNRGREFMSIFQAILLGGLYWIFGTEIGYGMNYPFFMQPLTLGPLVGIILGDVQRM